MNYKRFFAMIITSTVVMFALMYLNTYLPGHVFWSETRAYMAIVMGATMAFIMLAFMLSMYANRAVNIAVFTSSVLVFAIALWLVRSQVTVEDRSYMSAMIPHHSIAIMTSSRANISDTRVRRLADNIVYAQDKEIAEMRYLIADIDTNGKTVSQEPVVPTPHIVDGEQALSSEELPGIDPEFMTDEQIARLFPENSSTCSFRYTADSPPVLVVGESADGPAALVKISGDLVRLEAADFVGTDGGSFIAPPLSAELHEAENGEGHDLIMTAGSDYKAGFRGQYSCNDSRCDEAVTC